MIRFVLVLIFLEIKYPLGGREAQKNLFCASIYLPILKTIVVYYVIIFLISHKRLEKYWIVTIENFLLKIHTAFVIIQNFPLKNTQKIANNKEKFILIMCFGLFL